MNIRQITWKDEISIEDYNRLRKSVDFIQVQPKRAKCALENSLYKIVAVKDGHPIGMARVVGDGGYVYFICDVVVHPKYQSQGLGRKLSAAKSGRRGGNHYGKSDVCHE
jgi:ribosomal protein S18 acetylase RimI-like enzyme